MKKVRVQKMIADCGVASRRKAEDMIREGRVYINGKLAKLGDTVDPGADKITVDGISLASRQKYYIMLHKPRGYVATMCDELGRRCVADLVRDVPGRVYPVGRLDKDSEGLLLMTNDGDFANNVIHPSKHIDRVYRVTVHPRVTEEQLIKMSSGLVIDGYRTRPPKITVIKSEPQRTVLEIVLGEGRNREIRKMCEQVGLDVARLKRVAIGSLRLGMLRPGAWRDLTEDEVQKFAKHRATRVKANNEK